jgi:uncharacterized protein YndB with AHSA1/START domain
VVTLPPMTAPNGPQFNAPAHVAVQVPRSGLRWVKDRSSATYSSSPQVSAGSRPSARLPLKSSASDATGDPTSVVPIVLTTSVQNAALSAASSDRSIAPAVPYVPAGARPPLTSVYALLRIATRRRDVMVTAAPPVVRIEKTISATPHAVYRAWLEPEVLKTWLAPGDLAVSRAEVDERVGGDYRIWQTDSGADVGGFDCQLVALVPDQRVVLRLAFVGPKRSDGPTYDSCLTVTFAAAPTGFTALTLVHEQLDELAAAMPDAADKVGPGWELVLDNSTPRSPAEPSPSGLRCTIERPQG